MEDLLLQNKEMKEKLNLLTKQEEDNKLKWFREK